MQATKMRTPFAIQEILGLGVGSAAAAAAAGYSHPVHLHPHPALPPAIARTPPPASHNSSASSQHPSNTQRLSTSSPPSAHTPSDCNNAPISPASSTHGRHRDSRSLSPDVTRLSAAAAAAAAAAHVQLPVFNPANFYAAAGYAAADHAGQLNVAAHHHHMTTLAAAAYLRGFLPPGFSTPHEFRGHFQQHFGSQFGGECFLFFKLLKKMKVFKNFKVLNKKLFFKFL